MAERALQNVLRAARDDFAGMDLVNPAVIDSSSA